MNLPTPIELLFAYLLRLGICQEITLKYTHMYLMRLFAVSTRLSLIFIEAFIVQWGGSTPNSTSISHKANAKWQIVDAFYYRAEFLKLLLF